MRLFLCTIPINTRVNTALRDPRYCVSSGECSAKRGCRLWSRPVTICVLWASPFTSRSSACLERCLHRCSGAIVAKKQIQSDIELQRLSSRLTYAVSCIAFTTSGNERYCLLLHRNNLLLLATPFAALCPRKTYVKQIIIKKLLSQNCL